MKIRKNEPYFNDYKVYLDGILVEQSIIIMADDLEGKLVIYKIINDKPMFINKSGKVKIKKIKKRRLNSKEKHGTKKDEE